MVDSLEERLRSHAQAFDGLLSLIPAKYYYGEDTSDQWQRKKQSKEAAKNAKKAKLDPDSSKTAKDVMDENARKRKREEDGEGSSDLDLGTEMPREGLNRGDKSKKQKKADAKPTASDGPEEQEKQAAEAEARRKQRAEKRAAKREQKKAKAAVKQEQKKSKPTGENQPQPKAPTEETKPTQGKEIDASDDNDDEDDGQVGGDIDAIHGFPEGFKDEHPESASSAASTPIFDAPHAPSGSSSISSIAPATGKSDTKEEKNSTDAKSTNKASPEELKQRLQKRLEELRAARHADGINGRPARNRQELIEGRRQREEKRKAHKKELRHKQKEEEQRVRDEAIARRFSPGGSGSLLASPRSPAAESTSSLQNNFSYGHIAFDDGQQANASLSTLLGDRKQHGPQDPATAIKAMEAKQARLAGYDEAKRSGIEEKDMWLNAKKRAHGERVRDDTSLLKKALKRKESAKKKSEREWKERLEGVAKGKEVRQAKRTENIRKRKEEKGGKKGKGKARPGFEGSFKAKAGGKKK